MIDPVGAPATERDCAGEACLPPREFAQQLKHGPSASACCALAAPTAIVAAMPAAVLLRHCDRRDGERGQEQTSETKCPVHDMLPNEDQRPLALIGRVVSAAGSQASER
jgi:hypothetical protein